jgi:2-isopropylmalate synthase
MKYRVEIYDTTLRDGTQSEDISFSLEDNLKIARKLAKLGVAYIEGGWPGANPKDSEFFQRAKDHEIAPSVLAAFGSTRRPLTLAHQDSNLAALIEADTPAVTIVGKSWGLHIIEGLKTTLEENLSMVADSIAFLKSKERRVFFDAEHFFDGFTHNPDYARAVVRAAFKAGADGVVLCDTNGGFLPFGVQEVLQGIQEELKGRYFGIHTHNDSESAVANALVAVRLGASQVQGTINGFGERCGNASLCSLIPNLTLKMGIACIPKENLVLLKETSELVYELANLSPNRHLPYVGESAFTHKGGLHASAVQKNARTYEHVDPKLVGNVQRILVSELAGRSNVLAKAAQLGIALEGNGHVLDHVLKHIKLLEHQGYSFEVADGSLELVLRRALNPNLPVFFKLLAFRVLDDKRQEDNTPFSEATVMLEVSGKTEHTAAIGNGPVNALDNALMKALRKVYPVLEPVRLLDYKVRVLTPDKGTAAKVRVLIEVGDGERSWTTVGVSENVIEASWQALTEAIELKLLRSNTQGSR